jgi:excinuclease UvrABC nuclease subunit
VPFNRCDHYDFWDTDWREVSAVYGITNAERQVIYIGQTDNLRRRMSEHRGDSKHCMHRYSPKWVVVEVIPNEQQRLWRERQLIDEYDPPCNRT